MATITIQKYRIKHSHYYFDDGVEQIAANRKSIEVNHEDSDLQAIQAYATNLGLDTNLIETIVEESLVFYPLRVVPLLHPDYQKFYPSQISKIDVRKHLLTNTHLTKFITGIVKGRPEAAEYCNKVMQADGSFVWEKIARIRFHFSLNPVTRLVELREEILGFYNTNNEIEEEYTISSEDWNFQNPDGTINFYNMLKSAQESKLTLSLIIDDLKMKVNARLVVLTMTAGGSYADALYKGTRLFLKYESLIGLYISTGSKDLYNALLADTELTWLDDQMMDGLPAPGFTIRQFMLQAVE